MHSNCETSGNIISGSAFKNQLTSETEESPLLHSDLGLSSEGANHENPDKNSKEDIPPRNLGTLLAISFMVGSQLGSGIYASPGIYFDNYLGHAHKVHIHTGIILRDAGSIGASLLVWL
jgi:hypothetical protein